MLREYYTGFLEAFAGKQATNLTTIEARAVLVIAPIPAAAAKLSKVRIAAALRKAGRQRGIDALAVEIQRVLRQPQLRHPEIVEQAMGRQALALLATLDAECRSVDDLGQAAAEAFQQHPDHAIITSFPGVGATTGARLLAELGDDRTRFADARAVKAYAGAAPITRASGRSTSITHRRIKNDRLAAAGWLWAFSSTVHSDQAKQHYKHRREHGDRHAAALQNLFNRQLGQLFYCLQSGQHYDPEKAFPNRDAGAVRDDGGRAPLAEERSH